MFYRKKKTQERVRVVIKNSGVKYCEDCRYCRPADFSSPATSWEYAKCVAGELVSYSHPVGRSYCRSNREDKGKCGPQGKFFEPKENSRER